MLNNKIIYEPQYVYFYFVNNSFLKKLVWLSAWLFKYDNHALYDSYAYG